MIFIIFDLQARPRLQEQARHHVRAKATPQQMASDLNQSYSATSFGDFGADGSKAGLPSLGHAARGAEVGVSRGRTVRTTAGGFVNGFQAKTPPRAKDRKESNPNPARGRRPVSAREADLAAL